MLQPTMTKNDPKARTLIGVFSVVVFVAIAALTRIKIHVDLGFNVHVFALINAVINSIVAVLLVWALFEVRRKRYLAHKKIMLTAMILSIVFLVSYIAHHLLSGDTVFGDVNHDGTLDAAEKANVGGLRAVYLIILLAHIFLAAIILPFILFTAYRGLTSEFPRHKKIARWTWPIWFYVSLSGPVVYLLISPYYS